MPQPSRIVENQGVSRLRSAVFVASDQTDHIALRGAVALNVALRRRQARVPGQLLNVSEASTGLRDLLRRRRDEGAPTRMRRRSLDPGLSEPGQEPDGNRIRGVAISALAVDDGEVNPEPPSGSPAPPASHREAEWCARRPCLSTPGSGERSHRPVRRSP